MAIVDNTALSDPASYTGGVVVNIGGGDHLYGRSADALFVGGAGNVVLKMTDGVDLTLTGVAAGSILPIRHLGIDSTGTTATNMCALWQ